MFSIVKQIQPICFKFAGYQCLAEYFQKRRSPPGTPTSQYAKAHR